MGGSDRTLFLLDKISIRGEKKWLVRANKKNFKSQIRTFFLVGTHNSVGSCPNFFFIATPAESRPLAQRQADRQAAQPGYGLNCSAVLMCPR